MKKVLKTICLLIAIMITFASCSNSSTETANTSAGSTFSPDYSDFEGVWKNPNDGGYDDYLYFTSEHEVYYMAVKVGDSAPSKQDFSSKYYVGDSSISGNTITFGSYSCSMPNSSTIEFRNGEFKKTSLSSTSKSTSNTTSSTSSTSSTSKSSNKGPYYSTNIKSDGNGPYYCMGKNDTCNNKTYNCYDFYCDSCDPDGDNVEN